MKTMIRKEVARLWYALKIAAGARDDVATGAKQIEAQSGALRASSRTRDRASVRSPALVVISRAGRASVQAQHRRAVLADGSRPAYALPYNAHPAEVKAQVSTGVLADGDAGIVA